MTLGDPVEEVEKNAPTVEEALEAALGELGLSEQEAEVEILQEPKGGLLGLGSKGATVRVRPRRRSGPELTEDEIEEQGEVAAEFLEGLLEKMDIDADVETNYEQDHGRMYVEIWAPEGAEEEMGILIGHHGAVIESLQELVRIVVSQSTANRCMVTVDVEDYQKRHRARLAGKARDIAKRVQRSGRKEALEPMNPYDRKIVHDVVASVRGVESASEGEEPQRRVVISRSGDRGD